jgi:hypothetical protein
VLDRRVGGVAGVGVILVGPFHFARRGRRVIAGTRLTRVATGAAPGPDRASGGR